jgi:alkanesulfonate monooxygenase SsuD/methylene tetrahydromethanopterin reductase-like flavin-dependent oxidoreductase (luciferase family)
VDIGIGLDPTLNLNYEEQATISAEAAAAGYQQIWTPEGNGEDSFQLCALRWAATRDVVPGGVGTGIGVSQAGLRSPIGFAMSAGTLSKMTGGKFILGIGSGGADIPAYRRMWGVQGSSALGLMREYITTIRTLVRGGAVEHDGNNVRYNGAKLGINPPPNTPVYLGALGPEMVKLGGEVADGLCLNWSSPEMIAASAKLRDEGAARANRDPSEVKLAMYIRVCVDEDVDVARRAYARSMMGYALGQLGAPPRSYRAHFERMGFADDLRRIDDMRRANAPQDEIVEAFPPALSLAVGYFGKPEGAAEHFKKLAGGLDTAIVRVVNARPSIESTRAVLQACAPSKS